LIEDVAGDGVALDQVLVAANDLDARFAVAGDGVGLCSRRIGAANAHDVVVGIIAVQLNAITSVPGDRVPLDEVVGRRDVDTIAQVVADRAVEHEVVAVGLNVYAVAGVVLDEARGATVHAVARAGDVDAIASDPLDVVAQDLVVVAADVDPMSAGALIAGDIGVVEVNIVVPDDVGVAIYLDAVAGGQATVAIEVLSADGVSRDPPLVSGRLPREECRRLRPW
jgi:hypothetical protein